MRACAAKITLSPDEGLWKRFLELGRNSSCVPARLTLRLKNGRCRQALCDTASGSPEKPLSPDARREKWAGLLAPMGQERAARLLSELAALPAAAGAETLYAPEAGRVSSAVDGFEYLAPEDLEALTPRDLAELMAAEPESAGTMKLVSGWRWYFAAALTQAEAARFSEGDKLRIELPGLEAEARVESIGEAELGRRVIVLSSAEALARSLELRVCEARLCPEP